LKRILKKMSVKPTMSFSIIWDKDEV
jgi:hypothetical protein